MFKVNREDIRTTSTTPYSSVAIVNFELVIVSWDKPSNMYLFCQYEWV